MSNSVSTSDKDDAKSPNTPEDNNKEENKKAVPPSVDTSGVGNSPSKDDESGSSDYDSDTGSESSDDGSPPDLNRPKTPAHTLRNTEAEQWTHEELDEMQTGMIAELSRLLSTADMNDPMLDQLNMAVVTPRAAPIGHNKTSTMDSIFSFMSDTSEAKESDRSVGFFAIDPTEPAPNGPNNGNFGGGMSQAPLKSKSLGNTLMVGNNNNNFNTAQRGTDEYQNQSKMQVDKTIEKISASVDDIISKLEKDKTAFGKKTKDKHG